MGAKGHVQVIVPHVSESYSSQVGGDQTDRVNTGSMHDLGLIKQIRKTYTSVRCFSNYFCFPK